MWRRHGAPAACGVAFEITTDQLERAMSFVPTNATCPTCVFGLMVACLAKLSCVANDVYASVGAGKRKRLQQQQQR